jgi:hypothetical protein
MSTDFRPLDPIRMADLFDGRLEHARLHEHHCEGTTSDRKCLTDGSNCLWVSIEEGLGLIFTSYGVNKPQRILRSIANEFDVDIVSEHEPQFWGELETEEEQHPATIAKKHEQDFYNEVIKYVRGESHNIRPDTNGMIIAEIAKGLIAESPDLLAEDNRPTLIKSVRKIYFRDHQNLAFVALMNGTYEQEDWNSETRRFEEMCKSFASGYGLKDATAILKDLVARLSGGAEPV